jgi:hypothetical protein
MAKRLDGLPPDEIRASQFPNRVERWPSARRPASRRVTPPAAPAGFLVSGI